MKKIVFNALITIALIHIKLSFANGNVHSLNISTPRLEFYNIRGEPMTIQLTKTDISPITQNFHCKGDRCQINIQNLDIPQGVYHVSVNYQGRILSTQNLKLVNYHNAAYQYLPVNNRTIGEMALKLIAEQSQVPYAKLKVDLRQLFKLNNTNASLDEKLGQYVNDMSNLINNSAIINLILDKINSHLIIYNPKEDEFILADGAGGFKALAIDLTRNFVSGVATGIIANEISSLIGIGGSGLNEVIDMLSKIESQLIAIEDKINQLEGMFRDFANEYENDQYEGKLSQLHDDQKNISGIYNTLQYKIGGAIEHNKQLVYEQLSHNEDLVQISKKADAITVNFKLLIDKLQKLELSKYEKIKTMAIGDPEQVRENYNHTLGVLSIKLVLSLQQAYNVEAAAIYLHYNGYQDIVLADEHFNLNHLDYKSAMSILDKLYSERVTEIVNIDNQYQDQGPQILLKDKRTNFQDIGPIFPGSLPSGSYVKSCKDMFWDRINNTLSARCSPTSKVNFENILLQIPVVTLNLQFCDPGNDISNHDGVLVCAYTEAVPFGSYKDSCSVENYDASGILQAWCSGGDKSSYIVHTGASIPEVVTFFIPRQTVFKDAGKCQAPDMIVNHNGTLVCSSSGDFELFKGDYQEKCSSDAIEDTFHYNRSNHFYTAYCPFPLDTLAKRHPTTLNMDNCRSQVLDVDDYGDLICADHDKRQGYPYGNWLNDEVKSKHFEGYRLLRVEYNNGTKLQLDYSNCQPNSNVELEDGQLVCKFTR